MCYYLNVQFHGQRIKVVPSFMFPSKPRMQFSHMLTTRSTHLVLLDLIILMLFGVGENLGVLRYGIFSTLLYFLSFRSRYCPQHPVHKHSNTTKSKMDTAFADP